MIPEPNSDNGSPRLVLIGVCAALIVGAVFRLAWPGDIEYKGDEAWTYEQTRRIGVTEPMPVRGMGTSVGVPNPALSVTVFWVLARMTGAGDPPGLARAVQALNVCALLLFLVFVCRWVRQSEREAWLWGLALAALNPMAVLAHRKIWPPSVFLLVTLVLLAGWWRRDHRAGAFVWGLVSMIGGQIHLSAFFFAAGLALWAVLFDRSRVRWPFWTAGIVAGALPMIRWLLEAGHTPAPIGRYDVTRIPWLTFYHHWVLAALGLEAEVALGPHFAEFLAGPRIGSYPSYLVGLLHLIALGVGLMLLGPALGRLWRQRHRIGEDLAGRTSATAFTESAVFWGFGLLFTCSALLIHPHYLFVAFPLQWVWLAPGAQRWPAVACRHAARTARAGGVLSHAARPDGVIADLPARERRRAPGRLRRRLSRAGPPPRRAGKRPEARSLYTMR